MEEPDKLEIPQSESFIFGAERVRHTSSNSDGMPHMIGGSMTVRKMMQED